MLFRSEVREAAVVARDSGQSKQLVAYVVASAEEASLRARLEAVLPDYMVPAHIVRLERLPLTANGKLDRRALPEPHWQSAQYTAPRDELERQLVEIWQDVLAVERVGVTDNFFELGGDSLLTMQVVARIRNDLRTTVSIKDLFEVTTVAGLAERLRPLTTDSPRVSAADLSDLLDELEAQ